MPIKQLRELAKSLKLKSTGTKQELIALINGFMESGNAMNLEHNDTDAN